MSEHDAQTAAIIDGLIAKLDERQTISRELHADHHDYIAMRIEERRRCMERREKLIQTVGGWAIIAALTAIGSAVWIFINDHVAMK